MKYVCLIFLLLFICSNSFSFPLSEKELMELADQEVILLGQDPSKMSAYIDVFSFDKQLVNDPNIWKKINKKLQKYELWEIHYFPKARVFDGEIFVLIDKKSGKVFATFDMGNGTRLK